MSASAEGDDTGLVVSAEHELRALSKALVIGKFEGDGADVVWGSPLLSAVQDRLLAALSAREDGWDAWARADDKPWVVTWVETRVQEVSKANVWWSEAQDTERRKFVRDLFSPFRPSEELLTRLVAVGQ